jgi:hypothetical protein
MFKEITIVYCDDNTNVLCSRMQSYYCYDSGMYSYHYAFKLLKCVCDRAFFSMALPAHSGPRPLIQFLNYFSQTVRPLGRVISPSQGLYLNTGQHRHRINEYIHQISMPWIGFEPMIPASERAKTVFALDRAVTVPGVCDTATYPVKILTLMIRRDAIYINVEYECEDNA